MHTLSMLLESNTITYKVKYVIPWRVWQSPVNRIVRISGLQLVRCGIYQKPRMVSCEVAGHNLDLRDDACFDCW